MLTVSFNITLIITELIKATALVKKDNQIKPTVISMEELGSRIFNPDQGRGSQAG
jgi:DNA-directed RNA polymerase subunit K/omega